MPRGPWLGNRPGHCFVRRQQDCFTVRTPRPFLLLQVLLPVSKPQHLGDVRIVFTDRQQGSLLMAQGLPFSSDHAFPPAHGSIRWCPKFRRRGPRPPSWIVGLGVHTLPPGVLHGTLLCLSIQVALRMGFSPNRTRPLFPSHTFPNRPTSKMPVLPHPPLSGARRVPTPTPWTSSS